MTLKALLYIIATTNGTTEEVLQSHFKGGKIPFIRMYFYYQAYVEYCYKCAPIAKLLGDRDHSAVLWGAKKYSELLSINDPNLLEVINNTQKYLNEESNIKAKVRRA
jgi:hypothetical protein